MSARRGLVMGSHLMPFRYIGGRHIGVPPPALIWTHVQTDGSFRPGSARVATLITPPGGGPQGRHVLTVPAKTSTEAEWMSVVTGLRLALETAPQRAIIGIENDNLSVISGLLFPQNPIRSSAARDARAEILRLAGKSLWTGVRWIPREINRADALLR